MVIVQVIGGAASQMSAFSRGYVVAQRLKKELVLDVSDYINGYKFPYALDYFDLKYRKLKYIHTTPYVLSQKVIPLDFMEKYHPYVIPTEGKTIEQICEEALEHQDENIYMVGEGTTGAEYIENVSEVFKVREDNAFLSYFKRRIENIVSIAVHIRRTDFVSLGWDTEYAYYEAAIHYIEEKFPNAVFFFFSDDMESVQNHFGMKEEYRYVRLPGGFATDVVELLCMSLCNHRIMTKKSGYSQWARFLNTNPDAMNIIFSEETADNCISLNKQDVESHKQSNIVKRKVSRVFDWKNDEIYIEENIRNGNVENAMHRLCEIGFDSGKLTKEQLNKLYSYYENVLFMKEYYDEAEQALLGHMEFGLDFHDMYYNMAIVKRILGKTMASYLFASKICRESVNKQFIQEFVQIFHGDENYALFKQLCTVRKMHFILCPIVQVNFYKKYIISMAIILKQLGHEVSIINPRPVEIKDNVTEDVITEWCVKQNWEVDSSYQHHINVYSCAKYPGGQVYNSIIDKLAQNKDLPTIIIGQNLECIKSADKYPMIFLDFSEEKDDSTQYIKLLYSNWKEYESVMMQKAKAVITTDWTKGIYEKVKILPSYISQSSYYIDNEKLFTANYIDNEAFLKFVFEVLSVVNSII